MGKYILAIDQGTTGSTALIVDQKTYKVISKSNEEFPQIYPKPGEVEHDLVNIWASVQSSITKALKQANIETQEITSIGITNQRETTCAYTRDGKPLCNAIVWQDRRTSHMCNELKNTYAPLKQKTGLPLDPYFSGTKMKWLLENNSEVQKAAEDNNLCLSTIDSFLLYKLSNNKSYKTEPSNASRTLLMDLDSATWDDQLLSFFNIKKSFLPEITDSFSSFGQTEGLDFLPDGIPIQCILGDQQAALFGQSGHSKGALKCTYGTGAFILLNTGEDKIFSSHGLLTTVAYMDRGRIVYALEGSTYIAGAAVQWLRDNLKIIKTSADIETLANKVTNLEQMESLTFLPFFTGIGSPYWNADARGAIVGITRDTQEEHLARACLDGMALSVNDSIEALLSDSPLSVSEIKVDGGACANNLLMQIQSNFSNKSIVRPKIIETTAYGVALGCMYGLNLLSLENIDSLWKEDRIFNPENIDYYQAKSKQWKDIINKLY